MFLEVSLESEAWLVRDEEMDGLGLWGLMGTPGAYHCRYDTIVRLRGGFSLSDEQRWVEKSAKMFETNYSG